jgi:hypothetical protein
VAVKVAEVQNMARHVLRNALVLWLSGQHLNRPCKSGEATKVPGKQKWPTLRNVGIRYSRPGHAWRVVSSFPSALPWQRNTASGFVQEHAWCMHIAFTAERSPCAALLARWRARSACRPALQMGSGVTAAFIAVTQQLLLPDYVAGFQKLKAAIEKTAMVEEGGDMDVQGMLVDAHVDLGKVVGRNLVGVIGSCSKGRDILEGCSAVPP